MFMGTFKCNLLENRPIRVSSIIANNEDSKNILYMILKSWNYLVLSDNDSEMNSNIYEVSGQWMEILIPLP